MNSSHLFTDDKVLCYLQFVMLRGSFRNSLCIDLCVTVNILQLNDIS